MLNFKKPHTWVAVFVVAVIVIVAANFLTNQKTVSPVLSPHKMDITTKMLWQQYSSS